MVTKGIRSYERKERLKIRRENSAERDLRWPKKARRKLSTNYLDSEEPFNKGSFKRTVLNGTYSDEEEDL